MGGERFKLISDYRNNEEYRTSFCKLVGEIFGLVDFEEWFNKEYCNKNYIFYSYIHKDKVIANVSVNKFNIIIDGKLTNAIQLGTVMTHKDYRNKGLIRDLMNKIFNDYEDKCDFIYLFANNSVLDFYPKFGFKKVYENSYEMDTKQVYENNHNMEYKEACINQCKLRKLNVNSNEDKTIIDRLCKVRKPISSAFGVVNDEWPIKTYCNYMYKDNLYYIEDEDIIVILDRNNHVVDLYDILSQNEIDIDSIIEKVILKDDKKINFNFVPDSNKYSVRKGIKIDEDDTLFVKSSSNYLNADVLFPDTSHT